MTWADWAAPAQAAAYPLRETAGGEWSFLLPDGRLGCSARDPAQEAAGRCAGVTPDRRPLLLGLGAGHDLDALQALGVREVLAVEADPRSLATTLERWRRLGRPVPGRNCSLLFAPEDDAVCGLLAELLADEHGERPVLVHPHCATLWRPYAPQAADLVEDLLRSRASARRQEALLEQNAQGNRARLRSARDVADLAGLWGEAGVVVCGAGPGLDEDMAELRRARGLGLRLVAASTALPPLLAAGLPPDAVVATDPSPLLAADMTQESALDTIPLAVFPGASTPLVGAWPGPLWLALPEGPGLRRDDWEGRRPGLLTAGCGTVAGPALALAALLSRGPLFLVGVDLGEGGPAYARRVRRPADLPRPDFAFARRRMRDLVNSLRGAGRSVGAFGRQPDWLPAAEEA